MDLILFYIFFTAICVNAVSIFAVGALFYHGRATGIFFFFLFFSRADPARDFHNAFLPLIYVVATAPEWLVVILRTSTRLLATVFYLPVVRFMLAQFPCDDNGQNFSVRRGVLDASLG